MQVIIGGRRSGKTTKLIEMANAEGAHLIVIDENTKRELQPQCEKEIFVHADLLNGPRKIVGLPPETTFMIDNADMLLQKLLGFYQLECVSLNNDSIGYVHA